MSNVSHHSNSSSSSDINESSDLPDLSSLQPFQFDPVLSREEQDSHSSNEEYIENEKTASRIGHTDWCCCDGYCEPMQTDTESLCCRDSNELFESKIANS